MNMIRYYRCPAAAAINFIFIVIPAIIFVHIGTVAIVMMIVVIIIVLSREGNLPIAVRWCFVGIFRPICSSRGYHIVQSKTFRENTLLLQRPYYFWLLVVVGIALVRIYASTTSTFCDSASFAPSFTAAAATSSSVV